MPALKRPRQPFNDEEGEEIIDVESARSELRQNNPKKPRLSPELDSVLIDDDSDSATDQELDDLHASQFGDKQRRRAREKNQPADNGIIESVTCTNFMCHSFLEVSLGPLVNFVIGHNGSGKSAVLTAITICLGGKASNTNRAGNLKAFIKQGQDACALSVKLKNASETAYQQEVYGDSIIIERHFNRAGTSGFKLRSSTGKVISTRRADLEDISDYYGLQIDNPMTILTQDMARQFLNNSSPQEKYKFFIKGVQLEQLAQDYQLLEESIDTMETTFMDKRYSLEDRKGRLKKARVALAMSKECGKIRARIRQLSSQMAWAQVEEQERFLKSYDNDLMKADQTIANLEGKVALLSEQFEHAHNARETAQVHLQEAKNELDPITSEKEASKEKYDGFKTEAMQVQTEQRRIKESLREGQRRIAKFEVDIAEEYRKLEEVNGGSHAKRLAELDERKAAVHEVKRRAEEHKNVFQRLEDNRARAMQAIEDLKGPRRDKEQEVEQYRENLRTLRRDRGQQLSGFPLRMAQLITAIQEDDNFQEKPVGPIGQHVRLIKPVWSSVLEKSFGGFLNSFIVTSRQDQGKLSSLMRKVQCSCPILIGNKHTFDFSHNEPDEKYDTALRVLAVPSSLSNWMRVITDGLKVDNSMVLRQLIINQSVEQTLLVEDNQEGRILMQSRPRNVKQCYSLNIKGGTRFTVGFGGGSNSSHIPEFNGNPRMKTDIEVQISRQDEAVKRLEAESNEINRRYRDSQSATEECTKAIARHQKQSKELKDEVRRAESIVENLQDAIDLDAGLEGKLDALKKGLEETTSDHAMDESSYQESVLAKDKLLSSMKGSQEEMALIDKRLHEVETKVQKAEEDLAKLVEQRSSALQDKNSAIDALRIANEEKIELEGSRMRKLTVVTEYTEEANKVGPRVPVPQGESGSSLEKKLEKFWKDVQQHEKRHGGSEQQLSDNCAREEQAYNDAFASLRGEEDIAQELKVGLAERRKRWSLFKRYITARAKVAFQHLLSHRAYRGRLALNHKERVLDLNIQPDETQLSKGRQTKTLSGGEKSFSTICLLLALWEAMGAPIRCLDEFDVFMDSVNREITMDMLLAAARGSVSRQFIFITPQSMSSLDRELDVKIIKMQDPERNQTTINFPRT
ncbi:Structural maintenance of chromosomes protein 6 [Lambiella insularis]|nr:Structural maintenance of chromosomes protein 6 [Lambiella insularis]